MKREIKFRAWNTEMKQMVFPSLKFGREIWPCTYRRITTSENGYKVKCVLEMVSVDHILQSPEFEVMQYTGLKDRNGKEIYEGDIDQDGGIVFYNESWAMFMIDYGTGIDIANMEDVGNWMIVSGNIYETPQLLKP